MNEFAALFAALDETTKTTVKVDALARYFAAAAPEDAAWAVYFLSGRKPRQAVPSKRLKQWAREQAGVSEWLFDEAYHHVGDVAETVALLLPPPASESRRSLAEWVTDGLLRLRTLGEDEQRAAVLAAWDSLAARKRFVWNKLITGEFRVGVSQLLVVRAVAKVSGVDADAVAHRLMGTWEPTADFFRALVAADTADADRSRPYPFCLAHPLEGEPHHLGDPGRLAGGSGNGTASVPRWSAAAGAVSSGPAGRNW